jgi:hypothetical protein
VSKTTLDQQCESLFLELKDIHLQYTGKPEPALLKHFEHLGYVGSHLEGLALLTVLKALMLDKLAEHNIFHDRNDACCRYLEAQLTILKDKTDDLISSIKRTNKKVFLNNIREILDQPFIQRDHPGLSIRCCEALFDAIDASIFVKLAKKIAEDPYTFRNGWPDLTIVKGKDVQFIEVKTTDKLLKSQLISIPVMRKILPYSFSVYRVLK